jgi:hypothetical protein
MSWIRNTAEKYRNRGELLYTFHNLDKKQKQCHLLGGWKIDLFFEPFVIGYNAKVWGHEKTCCYASRFVGQLSNNNKKYLPALHKGGCLYSFFKSLLFL